LCQAANDELASAISANPTRLAGFALLPMAEPALAAEELKRCITRHKFVGALIDNHTNGQFYDDRKFWPVFAKAQELDVPIYIHPSYPDEEFGAAHYRGNYDDRIAVALGAYGWGWHSDTALSILRLYAAGLFDTYPNIKIIIGHMGEMLPFQLERVIAIAARFGRQRGLRDVWTQNIWVTTSGMFALAPLACLLQTLPIERVLYSVDYPFSANEKGFAFLEEVKKSGLIKEGEEWERFLYKNAQELLKVKV
jgi:predicted TIM-barrel fold metal-dependent hydrolase